MKHPTTIFINGKFLAQRLTGVQRHASQLVLALDNLLMESSTREEHRLLEWVLLTPPNVPTMPLRAIRQQAVTAPSRNLHIWEQFTLPWAARSGVLLNLAGGAPYAHTQQFITICDAAIFDHPEAYSPFFVLWYRRLFGYLASRAIAVLTISDFSRVRLQHWLGRGHRYIIVSCAVDHMRQLEADFSALERSGLNHGAYLLAVGSANPTKNFGRLVRAFSQIPADKQIPLVIVGGQNTTVFSQEQDVAHCSNLIYTGPIDDRELKALYQGARAFIFPSVYEGFGLPPLEAMTCGCPVAASAAASIPEICNDAALYFNPLDENDIRNAIVQMIENKDLREDLRRKGEIQAALFNWRISATRLLEVVLSSVSEKGR